MGFWQTFGLAILFQLALVIAGAICLIKLVRHREEVRARDGNKRKPSLRDFNPRRAHEQHHHGDTTLRLIALDRAQREARGE